MGGIFYDKYQSIRDVKEFFTKKQAFILPVLNEKDNKYMNVSEQIKFYASYFDNKFSKAKNDFIQNGWYTVQLSKETNLFMFSPVTENKVITEQLKQLEVIIKQKGVQFTYLFITNTEVLKKAVKQLDSLEENIQSSFQNYPNEVVIIAPETKRASPYQFKVLQSPKITILYIKRQIQILQIQQYKNKKQITQIPQYVQFSKYYETFDVLDYNSQLFPTNNSISTYDFFKNASKNLYQIVKQGIIPPSQFSEKEIAKQIFCASTSKTSNQFWFCMSI